MLNYYNFQNFFFSKTINFAGQKEKFYEEKSYCIGIRDLRIRHCRIRHDGHPSRHSL